MIAENKNNLFLLPSLQMDLDMMRPNRLPAMCFRITRLAFFNDHRLIPAPIWAEKVFAYCVEACQFFRAGKISKVVTALTILGFVIDDLIDNFHLSNGIIALEVGSVVVRVPQTKLDG